MTCWHNALNCVPNEWVKYFMKWGEQSLVDPSLMIAGYFGHKKSTNKSGPVQIKFECRTLASLHKRGRCLHLYLYIQDREGSTWRGNMYRKRRVEGDGKVICLFLRSRYIPGGVQWVGMGDSGVTTPKTSSWFLYPKVWRGLWVYSRRPFCLGSLTCVLVHYIYRI